MQYSLMSYQGAFHRSKLWNFN